MARTRSATYDDQRDTILAQAAKLFAEQGYTATSMNDIAAACGVSKAGLYHYWRDKRELLFQITAGHVARLEQFVAEVLQETRDADADTRLRALILRFVREYADAQNEHRVLTEDVKFLDEADRKRVLDIEREVVAGFARVVIALRPDLEEAALGKPLTMLLFGMINWLFTWMKPDGALGYDDIAPVVSDLFLAGLKAVKAPHLQTTP